MSDSFKSFVHPKMGILPLKEAFYPILASKNCINHSQPCISANYDPILMKLGTQTDFDMLSTMNLTLGVWRQFPGWPPRPCWKVLGGFISTNYRPILMKTGTQTNDNKLSPKIASPTVRRHFTRWLLPHFRKAINLFELSNYSHILTKSVTQSKEHMLSSKNTKTGLHHHFARWPPPCSNSIIRFWKSNYCPILLKVGTQTLNYLIS
jgi:hypothetical protein